MEMSFFFSKKFKFLGLNLFFYFITVLPGLAGIDKIAPRPADADPAVTATEIETPADTRGKALSVAGSDTRVDVVLETGYESLKGILTTIIEHVKLEAAKGDTTPEQREHLLNNAAALEEVLAQWVFLAQPLWFTYLSLTFADIEPLVKGLYSLFKEKAVIKMKKGDSHLFGIDLPFIKLLITQWGPFVRGCDALKKTGALNLQRANFLLYVLKELGAVPTSEKLSTYNQPGYEEKVVKSLEGETLVLIAQTYEHFLAAAYPDRVERVFEGELKEAYNRFKPVAADAPSSLRQERMLRIADIFTLVTKYLIDHNLFVYEKDGVVVDATAATLDLPSAKPLRRARRIKTSPAHRIFETLVMFAPLMLMSTIQSLTTQYLPFGLGEYLGTVTFMLSTLTILATHTLNNSRLTRFLVSYGPLLSPLNLLMRMVRGIGHSAIEWWTKGEDTPRAGAIARVLEVTGLGYTVYNFFVKCKTVLSVVYGFACGIIAAGPAIAGEAGSAATNVIDTITGAPATAEL